MANPDIPAALVVLATHLTAAGAALPDPIQDVDRGLPTGGRMIRYYWGGEVDPPKMPGRRSLNSDIVGQRFEIAATWPLTDLTPEQVTIIDVEMQLLAGQIRTRIDGDSQLGGNVTDLTLGNAEVDLVVISTARYVGLRWMLDLSYVEYALAP
jgi:hypothetical protein